MEILELTQEQEQKMLDRWNLTPDNPPSLDELSMAVFGKIYDGRSKEIRAVKKTLSKFNLKAKSITEIIKEKIEIELSEAHQEYIKNNVSSMNALEMAKIIFNNPSLGNLHAETRAVNEQIKSFNPKVIFSPENVEDIPQAKYEPPKTLSEALRRVNMYTNSIFEKDKLTPNQRKNLDILIGYLHTYRFIELINNFDSERDRKLCEDAFIRYTYDKPDLAQEEVDQYIELANQVVQGFKIQRRKEKLEQAQETIANNDPETIRLSMSMVEAIGKASTEYNACKKREQDLLKSLKNTRADRLKEQISDNASLLNWLQMWRNEEERRELIQLGEIEQTAVANEVERIASLPDIKARIFGIPKDNIKYG